MRLKTKKKQVKKELGTKRSVISFAWRPIKVDSTWIWLEKYRKIQVYKKNCHRFFPGTSEMQILNMSLGKDMFDSFDLERNSWVTVDRHLMSKSKKI